MCTVLGTVVSLTGMVEIVDANGRRVLLQAGDSLHDGDQLVTTTGSQLAMQTPNGEMVQFAEQQTVRLSEALLASGEMDISEQAVNPAVVQHVLAALQWDDTDVLPLSLVSALREDAEAFVSITHPSVSASLFSASEQSGALHINDVLMPVESQAAASPQALSVAELSDLVTQTTVALDMGLADNPLNNLLND